MPAMPSSAGIRRRWARRPSQADTTHSTTRVPAMSASLSLVPKVRMAQSFTAPGT